MVRDSDLAGFRRVYVVIMGASGIFVYPAIGLYDFFNFSYTYKTSYNKLYACCTYAVNGNKYNTYSYDADFTVPHEKKDAGNPAPLAILY